MDVLIVVIIIVLCRHGKQVLVIAVDTFAPKTKPPVRKRTFVLVN